MIWVREALPAFVAQDLDGQTVSLLSKTECNGSVSFSKLWKSAAVHFDSELRLPGHADAVQPFLNGVLQRLKFVTALIASIQIADILAVVREFPTFDLGLDPLILLLRDAVVLRIVSMARPPMYSYYGCSAAPY